MSPFGYELALPPFPAGEIDRVIALAGEIFGEIDGADFRWRIESQPCPSLALARDADGLVGFKFGYASTATRYHSWLGGVHARARRRGVARRLMELQHGWLALRGFTSVETGADPANAAMLALDREFGFREIGSYDRGQGPRVMMHKRLP